MIFELREIVREMLPRRPNGAQLSVVRLHSSRPTYLFFDDAANAPLCVAHVGDGERIRKTHDALVYLHEHGPDFVPRPLGCRVLDDGQWIIVESGARGIPWLDLARHLRSRSSWDRFREQALATLGRLHGAIRQREDWHQRLRPGEELRRQTAILATTVSDRPLLDRLAEAAARLDALREVRGFYQHGDYCVNNLIANRSRLTVIDFGEFGETSMPLHDQLSLALSLHSLSSGVTRADSLRTQVDRCVASVLADDPRLAAHKTDLLFHCLVWTINESHRHEERGHLRVSMLDLGSRLARSSLDAID